MVLFIYDTFILYLKSTQALIREAISNEEYPNFNGNMIFN